MSRSTRVPRNYFDDLYGRELLRAIASLTVPGGPDFECWDWQAGYSTDKGRPSYPRLSMRLGGRRVVRSVHRVSYEAAYGPLPPGEQVHHRCGRRSCVRPEHLQLATGRDNVAEMLVRRSLEDRIAALEAALAEFRPDHPVLEEYLPALDHPPPGALPGVGPHPD